jgi:hypothetical protein
MAETGRDRRPADRRIGIRIRVKPEHADAAAAMFSEAGFSPIYVECREDGDVSFWFAKEDRPRRGEIVEAIPRDFYALQAVWVQ